MSVRIHSAFDYRWAVIVLLSCLAACLTLFSTSRYGPGLTPDSADYIRLARDILENGFSFLLEHKAVDQPPLYPMALAASSSLTGMSILHAARGINLLASAGLVAVILLCISRFTRSVLVLVLIGLLASLSIPLTQVWSMTWTEPLFLWMVSMVFFLVSGTRHHRLAVLTAGLFTAAACLMRYAGIVLLPVVAVFLMISSSERVWNRLRNVTIYALPTVIFFALYVARNVALSGTALGERVSSNVGWMTQMDLAIRVVLDWFLPWKLAPIPSRILAFASICGVVGWLRIHPVVSDIRGSFRIIPLCLLFTVSHVGFIVWTSATTAYDPINGRLLSPIYPCLLILLAALLQSLDGGNRRGLVFAVCGIFLLWVSVFPRAYSIIRDKARGGAGGYNSRDWQESEIILYGRWQASPKNENIFSNVPDALYLLADVEAEMSPRHRFKMNSDEISGVNADNLFVRYPGLEGALLVWCDRNHRRYLFTPEELAAMCRLEPIRIFSDGTIYRIWRKTEKVE